MGLRHYGKTMEEIEEFLDDSKLYEQLSCSDGKVTADNLDAVSNIELAEECTVWRFPRGIFKDSNVLDLLSFDAADVIVIMGDDITDIDLQLLMFQKNLTFLRTLIVKDVKSQGYERLKSPCSANCEITSEFHRLKSL